MAWRAIVVGVNTSVMQTDSVDRQCASSTHAQLINDLADKLDVAVQGQRRKQSLQILKLLAHQPLVHSRAWGRQGVRWWRGAVVVVERRSRGGEARPWW